MEFPALRGEHFIAIQGKVFHRIRPSHLSSPIRWILHDGFQSASRPHRNQTDQIPDTWFIAMREALSESNPFVRELLTMRQMPNSADYPNLRVELLDEPGPAPEIAALIRMDNTSINELAPRTLQVFNRHNNRKQKVHATSGLWEPLGYPVLFPNGTRGWSPHRGKVNYSSLCISNYNFF
jgi:hypothetical protein